MALIYTRMHLLTMLLLALFFAHTAAGSMIQQSPNDSRDYQSVTLENGLTVLLISDPSADKAAAALRVATGSSNDPQQFPGLAHFLEHMLFLGTEKYPTAGSYEAYISAHSGNHNAYTASESTNYFFDIAPAFLAEALDRFSQFFIAPTLDAQFVNKERNAVHSEYTMKLKDDWRRIAQVLKDTANPAHPYSNFSVGNLDTLKDHGEHSLQAALKAFYQQHYNARNMNLVILGNQPLPKLAQLAKQYFAAIPTGQPTKPDTTQPLFNTDQLGVQINIVPNADIRQLQLNFPIPSVKQAYLSKPASMLGHLIGHEGTGSLLQKLKSDNLASGLSAGVMYSDDQDAIFSINIELTPQGLQQYQRITHYAFAYIDLLKQQGLQRSTFDEVKTMLQLDFQFKEKNQPIQYVTHLAESMADYPIQHWLNGNYLLTEFSEKRYQDLLSRFTAENLRLVLIAQGLKTALHADWYQTPYSIQPLTEAFQQSLKTVADSKDLTIPAANPFLPQDTQLRPLPEIPAAIPTLLHQDTGLQVWHLQDPQFRVPKSNIYLHINSSKTNQSFRDGALSWLMIEALNDALSEQAYYAQVAGQSYQISKTYNGIDIQISGFNDKQSDLMALILNQMSHLTLSDSTFARLKERLQRRWENAKKQKPFNQAGQQLYRLLISPSGSAQQYLSVLPALTRADLNKFHQQFFAKHAATLFVHGNQTAQETVQLMSRINSYLYKLGEKTEFSPVRVTQLNAKDSFTGQIGTEFSDSATTLYMQAPDNLIKTSALLYLAQRIIKSPFYTQLRTNEQLGYVVYNYPIQLYGLSGIGFTIQSPNKSADVLSSRMREFIQDSDTLFQQLTEEAFQTHQQALLVELEKEPVQLSEKTSRLWHEIEKGNRNFDSRQQLINAVKQLSLAELQTFYHQFTQLQPREVIIEAHRVNDQTDYPVELPLEQVTGFLKQHKSLKMAQ